MRGRISLPIPEPVIPDGEAFMWYRRIPGVPLSRDNLQRLSEERQEHIASQIATFLRETHQIPPDDLPTGLPVGEQTTAWQQFHEDIRRDLYPHMRVDAQEAIDQHFAGYLTSVEQQRFDPVFRHGDMGPGNILRDEARGELSGIIDFGSASLGDPAQDVGGLLASYRQPFIDRLSGHYPEIRTMLDRARFYVGTYALQQALAGLRDGDSESFEDGIAGFR